MNYKNGFSNFTRNTTNLLSTLLHPKRKHKRLCTLQEVVHYTVQKCLETVSKV